jgi:hypothetical protein
MVKEDRSAGNCKKGRRKEVNSSTTGGQMEDNGKWF